MVGKAQSSPSPAAGLHLPWASAPCPWRFGEVTNSDWGQCKFLCLPCLKNTFFLSENIQNNFHLSLGRIDYLLQNSNVCLIQLLVFLGQFFFMITCQFQNLSSESQGKQENCATSPIFTPSVGMKRISHA